MALDAASFCTSMKERLIDVAKSWRVILRLSLAPAIAWWISLIIFEDNQGFFAPIAAILTLTVGAGERVSIVFEILLGAALGILVGELFVHVIGRGAWQLVLIIALAVASARFVRLPGLALTQAVISGVLLVVIVPVAGMTAPALTRFADALIGGLVGLAAIILIPSNPIRELDRGIETLRVELAYILEQLAAALRDHNVLQAQAALEYARSTQPKVDTMGTMANGVSEVAKISPFRWGQRRAVTKRGRTLVDLDHAVRNTRVLARRSAAMLRNHEPVPAGLAQALAQLADLACTDPENREAMIAAAQLAITTAQEHLTINTASIASQTRALVADMLLAAGTPAHDLDEILDFD